MNKKMLFSPLSLRKLQGSQELETTEKDHMYIFLISNIMIAVSLCKVTAAYFSSCAVSNVMPS